MAKAVMSTMVDLGLYLVMSLPICFPVGQSSSKPSTVASRSEMVTPDLKPEQQRGLRLLKTVEGESVGLTPIMRAFVLWRASYVYTKLDPKHAEKLSQDAFIVARGIEDGHLSSSDLRRGQP